QLPKLEIAPAGGAAVTFTNPTAVGTADDGGRELLLSETGLAGLDVTRKILVPANGYFERYLERLDNPGTTDGTVDVPLQSAFGLHVSVADSSSGDATLGADDRWVALGSLTHPLVVAFAGVGGVAPDTASLDSDTLTLVWKNIHVPAGGTVELMH